MNQHEEFRADRVKRVKDLQSDKDMNTASLSWTTESVRHQYVYNFEWLGRPIIQYPQDMVAMQELIWNLKPDVVVETGIAHGGSLVLSASILAMLDYEDALRDGTLLDPRKPKRHVVGVDIDIRAHNRTAIEAHPMSTRINMIQGSSVDPDTVARVKQQVGNARTVLVALDSNHTHEHVLSELEAYGPLVTPGSYCVVFDTFVENLPVGIFPDRPWAVGNSPLSAVREYLVTHKEFEVDEDISAKLQITAAPGGFLKRKG